MMGKPRWGWSVLTLGLAVFMLAVWGVLLQGQAYAAAPPVANREVAVPAVAAPVSYHAQGSGATEVVTVCTVCPYTSVQAAVNAVAEGGLVKVAQGVYTDTNGDGVVLVLTRSVTVQGGYTTTDWVYPDPVGRPTILDGGGQAQGVYLAAGNATLSGLHIRRGSAERGAGLYQAGGALILRQSQCYSNVAVFAGGGLYVADGTAVLENTLFYTNTALQQQGGGVYLNAGQLRLHHTTLYDNRAHSQGGAVYLNNGTAVISASLVISNVATLGVGGVAVGGGATALLDYNDVAGNGGGNYSPGLQPGANTITATPRFVNAAAYDLRLQPGSPGLDLVPVTQTLAVDHAGLVRPFGLLADMGAYELYSGSCFVRVGESRVYTDIQEAVDSAPAGAEVKVAGLCQGVTARGGLTQTVYISKGLSLRGGYTLTRWSEADPLVYSTTLDALEQGRVIYASASAPITVSGLVVRNGYWVVPGGAVGGSGIYAGNQTLVDRCEVYNNVAVAAGPEERGCGGIYAGGATVQNSVIYSNTALNGSRGGGICLDFGSSLPNAVVAQNQIYSNTAGIGGGVYASGGAANATRKVITGNLIYANRAYTTSGTNTSGTGGGVAFGEIPSGAVEIINNLIYDNRAQASGGGIGAVVRGSALIQGNRIFNNYSVSDGGGIGSNFNINSYLYKIELYENLIYSNTAARCGGGLYHQGPPFGSYDLVVERNAFYSNTAQASSGTPRGGGGVYVLKGSAASFIQNNLFYNNSTGAEGGGLAISNDSKAQVHVRNNTFYNNRAAAGGGLYNASTQSFEILNNLIFSNTAYGFYQLGAGQTIDYNAVWGNGSGDYLGMSRPLNDVTGDPQLVNPDGGDFRLQATSPCVNSASPISYTVGDYAGFARPFGPRADIGAYELYTGTCFVRLATGGQVYNDLQTGVNLAPTGGELRVAGLCQGVTPIQENGTWLSQTLYLSRSLTVRGGFTPANWTTPTTLARLEALGAGRVVYLTGTGVMTVSGFILRGGSAPTGGGLYVATALSPALQNLIFYGNTATAGGAIAVADGAPRLNHLTIAGNTATTGGGLYLERGQTVLYNSIVVSNTGGGVVAVNDAAPILAYNNVWGNAGGNYLGVAAGPNSLSEDPRFVDWPGGDLHLAANSPCIHQANPATALTVDFEGDYRPLGRGYDLGADESTLYPDLALMPLSLSATGMPGQPTTYLYRLTNSGTVTDSYEVTHTLTAGSGSGWLVTYTNRLTLPAGMGIDFPVAVGVPPDAASGSQAVVRLTARSRTLALVANTVSNTTTISQSAGVQIGPVYSQTLDPGQAVLYTHVVTNLGNLTSDFTVTLASSTYGWASVYPARLFNVEPLMTATVMVSLTVPGTAAANMVETTAIRVVGSQGEQAWVTDTTTVRAVPGDRYVDKSGVYAFEPLNNCLDRTKPCRTIGYALLQALNGDTVRVQQGTYNEYNLTLNKNITLRGGYDFFWKAPTPDSPAYTVIDAQNLGRVMYIFGNPRVEWLTLRNGSVVGVGGGVYIGWGAPVLQSNIFENNRATSAGGGLYNYELNIGAVQILSNTFRLNQAAYGGGLALGGVGSGLVQGNLVYSNTTTGSGGGIYVGGGSHTVQVNQVTGNQAGTDGGGLYNAGAGLVQRNLLAFNQSNRGGGLATGAGTVNVWNNLIYGNQAGDGAGLAVTGGTPRLWHNTIYSNSATSRGGGLALLGGTTLVSNTIIVSNTAVVTAGGIYSQSGGLVDYNDVWGNLPNGYVGLGAGPHDLATNPLFINAALWDLRLQTTSPLVNVGAPAWAVTEDYWGDARPLSEAWDIGADELRLTSLSLAPNRSGAGQPAVPLTYTHWLTNTGNYTDTFLLTAGPGWNAVISPATTLVIGRAQARLITVTVTVPRLLSGTATLTVTAARAEDPAINATVTETTAVLWQPAVALTPDREGAVYGTQPQIVVYTHTLTNLSNYTTTLGLTAQSLRGFTVTVHPTQVTLPMDGMATVFVSVTAQPAGGSFLYDTTWVTASLLTEPGVTARVTDTTYINRVVDFILAPSASRVISPGIMLSVNPAVTNTGDYTDTYLLSSTSSQGWFVQIPEKITQLGPQGTRAFNLRIFVPSDAAGGTQDVTVVTATSTFSPTVSRQLVNTTTVPYIVDLTLVPTDQITTVLPGVNRVVYVHRLTGSSNTTGPLTLTAASDNKWTVALTPQIIPLTRSFSATIYMTLTVPTTATTLIEDRLTLTATYRVTSTPQSWPLLVNTTLVSRTAGLALQPVSAETQSGIPGTGVFYTYTLRNLGNYTDTFNLQTTGVGVLANGSMVTLGASRTATVTVQVLPVPMETCATQRTGILTATSQFSPAVRSTRLYTLTFGTLHAVQLQASQAGFAFPQPAETVPVTYWHTLTNTGNCTNTFTVTATTAGGWTTTAIAEALTLPRDGATRVTVTVFVPPTSTTAIFTRTTWVTAAVSGQPVTQTNLDTTWLNRTISFTLAPAYQTVLTPLQTAPVTLTYLHTLTHTGNYTDNLQVTLQSAWGTLLSSSVFSNVAPGATRPITVRVVAPPTVFTATDLAQLTVRSLANPAVQVTVEDATLIRRPAVALTPTDSYQQLPPATRVTYVHWLENSGGLTDTYTLTATQTLPDWTLAFTPTEVRLLWPGQTVPVTLTWWVPEGTLSGTVNTVRLTATGQLEGPPTAVSTDTVLVPYVPLALFSPAQQSAVTPGTLVSYTHVLTNAGNYTETFRLSVFTTGSFDPHVEPDMVQLGPGQASGPLVVTLLIPSHAVGNVTETTRLEAAYVSGAAPAVSVNNFTFINLIPGTRYVAPSGTDVDNNCTQPGEIGPCATLQHAVNQAVDGDEIRVAAGTYTGSGRQVVLVAKSITLTGGYAPTWHVVDPLAYPTILDGQTQRRVLAVTGGAAPVIQGFQLRRGQADSGAGLFIESGSPTLRNNWIYSNTATFQGGGIYYGGSDSPRLERNTLRHNTAGVGAALYLRNGTAWLANNLIYRNTANDLGGGLYVYQGAPRLWHNTFYSNTAKEAGGGILNYQGTLAISNTLFLENYATTVGVGGAIHNSAGSVTLDYSLAWNDGPLAFYGLTPGPQVLSADPRLVNPVAGDLHLTGASPCLNAGAPGTPLSDDRDGSSRPLLGGYDIGALEYGLASTKAAVSPVGLPGDWVTWTLTLTNQARLAATFSLTDALHAYLEPGGFLTYTAGSGGYSGRTLNWQGTVNGEGGTVRLTFTAQITDWLAAGVVVTNVAWVDGVPTAAASFTAGALPGTRYLALTGTDTDNNCRLTWKPCATFQWTVDQALSGDEVRAAAGTYTGTGTAVVSVTRPLTLTGGYALPGWTYNPEANVTYVDGAQVRAGVLVSTTGEFRLSGFHILRTTGVGLSLRADTAVISRTRLYSGTGDGLRALSTTLQLARTWIYTQTGDGLSLAGGSYDLVNLLSVQNRGAGLRVNNATGRSRHLTLAQNQDGGAVITGTAYFTNTIFYSQAPGLHVPTGSTVTLWSTLWYGNSPDVTGSGTATRFDDRLTDPRFINPTGFDYRLQPTSGALNAGVAAGIYEDIAGRRRPLLGGYDIGAYEFPLALTKQGPASAAPNQLITYTLIVSGEAAGLRLTDGLPDYLNYGGSVACGSGDCRYVAAQRAITWTGSVLQEQPVAITYTGRITSWLAMGVQIVNTATLQLDGEQATSAPITTTISGSAGPRYVAREGRDTDNSCRIVTYPCATVQRAVGQANAGEQIRVASGTYTAPFVLDRALTVTGGYTRTNWTEPNPEVNVTRLQGVAGQPTVRITDTVTLDGFRVVSGTVGILVENATATLVRTHVYSSTGDGLRLQGGELTLDQVRVYGHAGHGLVVTAGQTSLLNTVVARNNGIGADLAAGSSEFRHVTLAANRVAGVRVGGTAYFTNTIFYSHTVGISVTTGGLARLAGTLWYSNTANQTQGSLITLANSYGDPRFINPAALDYRLQGDSAAINGGLWAGVSFDAEGDWRPDGMAGYWPDLGADQYPLRFTHQPTATLVAPCAVVTPVLTLNGLRSAGGLPGVRLTETLASAVGYLAGSLTATDGQALYDPATAQITWTGWLLINNPVTVGYSLQITPNLVGGTLLPFTTTLHDPVSRFALPWTLTVLTGPVTLEKTAPPTVTVGQRVTYTVVFTVPVGQSAIAPLLVETLPRTVGVGGPTATPALTYVVDSASVPPESVSEDGGVITWTLPTITGTCDGPQSLALTFQAQVRDLPDNTAGDSLTNTLTLVFSETVAGPLHTLTLLRPITLVEPALSLSQTVVPALALATDDTVAITLTVANQGSSPLYGGWLTDTLPLELSWLKATPGYKRQGQQVIWAIGPLAAGEVRYYTLTATVSPTVGAGLTFTNVATLTGAALPGAQDGVRSYEALTAQPLSTGYPELVLTKASNESTVLPGWPLIYTLHYTNTGAVRAEGVQITDTLPELLTGVISTTSLPATVERAGTTITWTLTAPLSRGISGRLWLTGTVDLAALEGDVLTNTAGIATQTSEPVLSNNQALITVTVLRPALAIGKAVHPAIARPGEWLTYTLRITNTGRGGAYGLVVTDTLPALLTNPQCQGGASCGVTGNVITWTLQPGVLHADETALFTVSAQVTEALAYTPIINDGFLVTAAPDVSASGEPVTAQVDLRATALLTPAQSSSTFPGQTVTYQHWLTNTGNLTDTFALTAFSAQGWDVTVLPTQTAPLAPTAGTAVTMTLTVSSQALSGTVGSTLITATGSLGGLATVTDQTTVGLSGTVVLQPPRSSSGLPGEAVVYWHTLSNTANLTDTFMLSALSSQGWNTQVASPVLVPPFGAVPVAVTVTIPTSALSDTVDLLRLTAQSSLRGSAAVTDTTTVGLRPGLSLLPSSQSQSILPGGTAFFVHTLTNQGNFTATFTLTAAELPGGWQRAVTPTTALLAPAASTPVTLAVTALPGTLGSVTATLTAAWPGLPAISVTVTDTVAIGCVPLTTPTLAWAPLKPFIGQMVTFTGTAQPLNATTPLTYTWNFGDGTPEQTTRTDALSHSTTHRFASDGTFNVSLTVVNACGSQTVTQPLRVEKHHIFLPLTLRNY